MAQRRVLTQLPRDLGRFTGHTIAYRYIWSAAVEGRIQAEQGNNGRWTYDPADVPQIAAALGLPASQVAA
ncbi:hypothetical protein [Teichococcus vastitatis]|uniref:hypothetical protein n=1 Tax=Teichococcus vastitatis TaxID=2307076 RepID=UPI000E72683E|nr:hypothetical protein [Pseudoroseomonas vastitatis]